MPEQAKVIADCTTHLEVTLSTQQLFNRNTRSILSTVLYTGSSITMSYTADIKLPLSIVPQFLWGHIL